MASPMPAPSPTGSAPDSNASAAAAGTGNTGEGQEGGSIGMETAQTCGSEEGFSSLMDDEMMINDLESFDGFGHQVRTKEGEGEASPEGKGKRGLNKEG